MRRDLLEFKEFGSLDSPSLSTLFMGGRYEGQDIIVSYLENGETLLCAP